MPATWRALAALPTVRRSWPRRTGEMPVLHHHYYFFAVGGNMPFWRRYIAASA